MILVSIKIANFRSYGKPTEFLFKEAGTEQRNIYLIGGLNGAGKTAFLDAVKMCFFGAGNANMVENAYGKNKLCMSDNLNHQEKENGNYETRISVSFKDDFDKYITLERIWRPKRQRRASDDKIDLEETVSLSEEGKRLIWPLDEIQEWIENEIPSSTSKFFFFDGEQIQHFAYEEEENTKLKDSIELLLGIELYRSLRGHLEEWIVKKLRAEAKQNFESEVLRLEADAKELDSKLQEIAEDIDALESELKLHKQKQKLVQEKQEQLFGGFDAYSQSTRNNLFTELERKKGALLGVQKDKKEYIQDYFPFALLLDKLTELKQALIEEKENRMEIDAHAKLSELVNRLVDECLIRSECVCGRKLADTEKVRFKEVFLNLIHRSTDSKKSNQAAPIFNLSAEQEMNAIEIIDDMWKSGQKVQQIIDRESNLKGQVESIQSQMETMATDESRLKDFRKIQQELDNVTTDITRTADSINRLKDEREQKQKELALKYEELDLAQEKKSRQEIKTAILKKAKAIKELLNQYIDALRGSKLGELEKHTTDFYNKLQTKISYQGQVKFDENTFSTTIIRKDGRVLRKIDLSAGEKELYAVSLIAGLCKTAHKILPVIIDTPLSRLDSNNRRNVVEKYYPQAGKQVILLSTDEEIYGRYYEFLKDYILDSFLLKFDPKTETTMVQKGYFQK